MRKLGVNIDHVATLRQARGALFPSPVEAAILCQLSGANSIVAHLREDRRHIQDRDVADLKKGLQVKLNMEISRDPSVLKTIFRVLPESVTLVPEKRVERTTESGIDTIKNRKSIEKVIYEMKKRGIAVSLFVDPSKKIIAMSKEIGADDVEIHTGPYANAKNPSARESQAKKVEDAVGFALSVGLMAHVGHGLDYENVTRIAEIRGITEFNIGFSIISRAVFLGLKSAVTEMKRLIEEPIGVRTL